MLVKSRTGSECIKFSCIFSCCVHRDSDCERLVGEKAVVTVFVVAVFSMSYVILCSASCVTG